MSFSERGFLSSDSWRDAVRKSYPTRMRLCDEASDLCQRTIDAFAKDGTLNQKTLLAGALFIRLTQFVQSAIILVETGAITSARTLVRAGYEAAFFLGAAVQHEDFHTIAMQDYSKQITKFLRSQIDVAKSLDPNEYRDLINVLQSSISDTDALGFEKKEAGVYAIARLANMTNAYDVFYRGLSTDSAHTNLFSIREIYDVDSEQTAKGFQIGRAIGDYPDTLYTIVALTMTGIEQANFLLKNQAISARQAEIWNEFEVFAVEQERKKGLAPRKE